MRLRQYFSRIESTLHSRLDAEVEKLVLDEIEPDRAGVVEGRLRFWDGSLLRFAENIAMRGVSLVKLRYSYHYQDRDGKLRFRYDNVPHHPEIATHPHHKHVGASERSAEAIVASDAPDLNTVLREIDQLLQQ